MGLPSINIAFVTRAAASIERAQKGVVGIIIRDSKSKGAHDITKAAQIPELSVANTEYVQRAFTGYVSPPRKIILYNLASSATDLSEGLSYMETRLAETDYIVGPPDITEAEATELSTWVKGRRGDGNIIKAVLPNCDADSEGIINFTTEDIVVGGKTLTTAQFCSRIAGLIAGTPINISCTYAPLTDVTSVAKLTRTEMDAAIDAGEFIIFHDGRKVKVGRGVNSLVTTNSNKGDDYKKIKFVEAVDMITRDINATAQDAYIGKYANSYDNKCLLISAINGYFEQLERDGVLDPGQNSATFDAEAQEAYLQAKGIDTSEMSEREIKEANTGDKVLLSGTIKVLDAIEDIGLKITI